MYVNQRFVGWAMISLMWGVFVTSVYSLEPPKGTPPKEYAVVESTPPGERVEAFFLPEGRKPTWFLGVGTVMTNNGCLVTEVVENSPAWYLGLEVDDYITAVDGYEVGAVGRFGYPLYSELRRAKDGLVELTITDRRTKRTFKREVQLALQRRR